MVALFLALVMAPIADVAPPPRPIPHRHPNDCLCPEGDLRCRARAAFAFEVAKVKPKVTEAHASAAKRAFEDAARALAASKVPSRP